MNSWQSTGEAHKNKPVVQFLAMVMRLEIITGGASRSKSSSWDKTGPIYLGQGAPWTSDTKLGCPGATSRCWGSFGWKGFGNSACSQSGSQVQHPHLPIFGAVTNGCFCLLLRQGIVFQRWGLFAFVRDLGAAALRHLHKACSRRWLLQRALLPLILGCRRTNPDFVCRGIFELGSAQCHRW